MISPSSMHRALKRKPCLHPAQINRARSHSHRGQVLHKAFPLHLLAVHSGLLSSKRSRSPAPGWHRHTQLLPNPQQSLHALELSCNNTIKPPALGKQREDGEEEAQQKAVLYLKHLQAAGSPAFPYSSQHIQIQQVFSARSTEHMCRVGLVSFPCFVPP